MLKIYFQNYEKKKKKLTTKKNKINQLLKYLFCALILNVVQILNKKLNTVEKLNQEWKTFLNVYENYVLKILCQWIMFFFFLILTIQNIKINLIFINKINIRIKYFIKKMEI